MNIFDLMESYRSEQIAMLKSLLSDVAKSILALTESIPKEILLENFKNVNRRYVDIIEKSDEGRQTREVRLSCDGTKIGEFTLDTTAIDKLNKFLSEAYPGVSLTGYFTCDLYEKCIEFPFCFQGGELEADDFVFYSNHKLEIKMTSWEKAKIDGFYIFNDDISMWLTKEFDEANWDDCLKYSCLLEGQMYCSKVVEYAYTHISIPLELL